MDIAVGGTSINEWASGEPSLLLQSGLLDLLKAYRPTQILFHQGERDFALHTSTEEYKAHFKYIVSAIRSVVIDAPIYISTASYESKFSDWTKDNSVTIAQRALVNGKDLLQGP